MNRLRLVMPVLLAALSPLAAQETQFVVAQQTRAANGQTSSVSFEPAAAFTINGRDRIRSFDSGKQSVSADAYKKLPRLQLNRAGILRRTAQSQFVRMADRKKMFPILPDDVKFKSTVPADSLWNNIRFSSRKSKRDKTETAFSGETFFALIPTANAPAGAVAFVLDASNFDNLNDRIAAIAGVVKSFPKAPEIDSVRAFLDKQMQDGYEAFESGGSYQDFLVAVQYANLSQTAFPGVAKLAQLNRDIQQRKEWTESNLATLHGLLNNRDWDDFLQKYLPFERYQSSFPDLVEGRRQALLESARQHVQNGQALLKQGRDLEGMKELRFALGRDPNNERLQRIVEDARLGISLALAKQRALLRKPLPAGSPQEIRFNRHLEFADLYTRDKKFDEAETELVSAEELDKDSPRLLLYRAKLNEGKNQLAQASALLDAYDENVVTPDERSLGEQVRIKVLYNLKKLKEDYKQKLGNLYSEGRYTEAFAFLPSCLDLDPNDEDFLYYSGILSAIVRKNDSAVKNLQSYLSISTSLRGDLKKRERAYRVLQILDAPRPVPANGAPNWLSGRKLPPDVFYCPESIAFQSRVESIKGHKVNVQFTWVGEKLVSINTVFDDPKARQEAGLAYHAPQGAELGSFHFGFYPEPAQLFWISSVNPDPPKGPDNVRFTRDPSGGLQLASAGDPKAQSQRRYVTLLANPQFNLDVLAYIEGPAAIGFAGNPYFNPFIWDGIHMFRFSYDNLARVETASEIGTNNVVKFSWSGNRLQKIAVYASDRSTESPIYTRLMSYGQDQLLSETVNYNGKTYKISYKYEGKKLSEASFDDTGAHDGKSYRVRFLQ